MIKIKFKKKGRWAEKDVSKPQFEVEANEIKEVSLELAESLVDGGFGVRVEEVKESEEKPEEKVETENKKENPTPSQKDKAKAESGKSKSKY